MNIIKKILFFIKKPKVILITGIDNNKAASLTDFILKTRFSVKKVENSCFPLFFKKSDIFIFNSDLKDISEIKFYKFLLKNSSFPVLIAIRFGDVPKDKIVFPGNCDSFAVKELLEYISKLGFFIFNFDDESLKRTSSDLVSSVLSFGFHERSDLRAEEININNNETNFKVRTNSGIIPFWINRKFEKEMIYIILSALCAGAANGINLVEMSQLIKEHPAE